MRRFAATAIVVAGALLGQVLAAPQRPIAVVTDLRGDVRLQRAGEAEAAPLRETALLRSGDRLLLGSDAGAALFQLYAPVVAVGPNRTVTVQALAPSTRADGLTPELFALVEQQLGAAVRSMGEKSVEVRGGANEIAVTALAPRHALVLEGRPTFEWAPVKDAASYKVTVYSVSDNILWQTTTRETHARSPAGSKPLAPGEYAWEVLAQVGSRKGLDTATFTVATREQAARIRPALERAARLVAEPGVTNLPYAAVALRNRLYPQAEAALKPAIARAPQDRVLRALMMRLYQLTHRSEEREKARPIAIDAK